MQNQRHFLFLEPFFSGSHREFAEGLVENSRYRIDLVTLPARFWKWRMRGAALYFFDAIKDLTRYDGLITTDLMSLSDFIALCRGTCPPALVYFHENQLTYPLAPGEIMDVHFGFTDITTCLAATRVLFNSKTHYHSFFSALPAFLRKMPDYRPDWVVKAIRSRADVLHPGCRFPACEDAGCSQVSDPPLIVWNHRWEFDKNPQEFFQALRVVLKMGCRFRLALLGENFTRIPSVFTDARNQFRDQIVQYGYVKSREEYLQWLKRGDIVVSTAHQENFGISVVEAIRFGCIPLLPCRLSYPEIIPRSFHGDFLYRDSEDLIERLCLVLSSPERYREKTRMLSCEMNRFSWDSAIVSYDRELENLADAGPSRNHLKPEH